MKKDFLLSFFVASSLVFLGGCLWDSSSKKELPSPLVINVLDKEFYDDCHIPGSIQISMEHVLSTAEKDKWPKDTKIVVYCSNHMCTTSTDICRKLSADGFTHVWDYEAGMAGWYQAKLPVEGPAKAAYLTQPNRSMEGFGAAAEGVKVISTEELHSMMEKEKETAAA